MSYIDALKRGIEFNKTLKNGQSNKNKKVLINNTKKSSLEKKYNFYRRKSENEYEDDYSENEYEDDYSENDFEEDFLEDEYEEKQDEDFLEDCGDIDELFEHD